MATTCLSKRKFRHDADSECLISNKQREIYGPTI